MALRMVEMVLPETPSMEDIEESLADFAVLGIWTHELSNDQAMARILVRSDATEAVIEHLAESYSFGEEYRAWITEVAATMPKPETKEEEEDENGEDKKDNGGRVAVAEIVESLSSGGDFSSTFVLTTFLATVVACAGLLKDSVAVVVGAMVIAPLLAPTMGISLGTTLGDIDLIKKGSRNTLFGFAFSIGVAAIVGFAFNFSLESQVLVARTHVDLLDLALALAAGSAGALAFTSGIAGAVVGVMVAVALLPPLAAAGLYFGAGQWGNAGTAVLLYVINITCMILSGVVTFWAKGVRPKEHWEEERAKKMVFRALAFALVSVVLLVVAVLILDGTIPVPFIDA